MFNIDNELFRFEIMYSLSKKNIYISRQELFIYDRKSVSKAISRSRSIWHRRVWRTRATLLALSACIRRVLPDLPDLPTARRVSFAGALESCLVRNVTARHPCCATPALGERGRFLNASQFVGNDIRPLQKPRRHFAYLIQNTQDALRDFISQPRDPKAIRRRKSREGTTLLILVTSINERCARSRK